MSAMNHGMKKLAAGLACAVALCAGNQTGAATIQVDKDIAGDVTWVNTNVYLLKTAVFVTNGATLTIEPGTLIRGEKDGSIAIGTNPPAPGTLIISRGSKIRAMGTASQPIVMTNTNDDFRVGATPNAANGSPPWNTPNNQIGRTWGGLILLGQTYVARGTNSPDASISVQIEGLQPYGNASRYGGGNDDDDSGELHYMSIRYGGYVLGTANEINGLTMGAVGRNTEIDHIEVFQNKDDGYEWFGGTVNTKYLVSWNNADDSFDWDEGFRGKGQFWLAVQGPLTEAGDQDDFSDKGAEMDGATSSDSGKPSSAPTIYNATLVGDGKGTKRENSALHFRDGGGGRWNNSMFLDFGGACGLVEGALGGSYDSANLTQMDYVNDAYYTHSDGGKMLQLKHCLFWNFGTNVFFECPTNSALLAGTWGAEGSDGDKAHYGYPAFSDTTLSNVYVAEPANSDYPFGDATNLPIVDLVRSAHPVLGSGASYTDSVANTYYPVESIEPSLGAGHPLLTAGQTPPADGFYTPISMVGAFGTRMWAGPWTVANRLGLMYSATANYSDYESFDQYPEITNSFNAFTVQFPTANGQPYNVDWAPAAGGPWQTLASITGNGGTYTYTDQRPNIEQRYYRLTTQISP
jgi:hypothetical protein